MSLATATHIVRPPGDPRIQQSGPSSLTPADNLARGLGWFSLALGIAELIAPRQVAQAAGLKGKQALLRAYGAREMLAGVQTLSIDKPAGLASRILGDLVDIATLLPALSPTNPKRGNAALALGVVAAITVIDCMAFKAATTTHSRNRGQTRDYSERSGFPRGIDASRGAARHTAPPSDHGDRPSATITSGRFGRAAQANGLAS